MKKLTSFLQLLLNLSPTVSPSRALPDSDDLADGESQSSDLRDEDGGHGFVEGGAVHVDGGADGDDEAGHAPVNVVLLLKALEGHWQGS